MIATIALGSNIGERLGILKEALSRLKGLSDPGRPPDPQGFRVSHVYETRPWGLTNQPDFLNAVVRIAVPAEVTAPGFLRSLKAIEVELGRVPATIRWGPRALDLDLLDFDGQVFRDPDLTLPHPRIAERSFVLVPLCEIAPDWRDPLTGRTAVEMLVSLNPEPSEARLFARCNLEGDESVGGSLKPRLPRH